MRAIHDADCAVILDVDADHDRRIACTCRERMRKKQAKRPRNTNGRPIFDGAVSLGDGNYYRRALPTSDGY
jgi:hypothetical protein